MGALHSLIWLMFLLWGVVLGCGKPSKPSEPKPEPEPWGERAASYEAELERHREAGWLVVRTADGYRDEGDSLTWSGEAMGVSCAQAERTLAALEAMQDKEAGYYVRVDPLPVQYVDELNVVSRDGWISVAYGMTRVWRRCPDLQARMAASWQRAQAAVGDSVWLHPNALQALVLPSFRYLTDAIDAFSQGDWPAASTARRLSFELATEATVHSVVASKSPCYPLHLVFSEILSLSAVGLPISTNAKRDLCEVTKSTGLINWRWYCQDESEAVESWLEKYRPNQLVYAHQRCSWESEDFPPEDTVASLDWLTLRDLYVNGG